MNPYAVAQKTHLVNGVLGYEAQLVNAVISSSSAIVGRFHYEYGGDWERIAGQKEGRDELGLFIRVGAVLREADITWGENIYRLTSPPVTRHCGRQRQNNRSPISQLSTGRACTVLRSFLAYTARTKLNRVLKINPAPKHVSLSDISGDNVTTTQSAQEAATNIDVLADEFRDRIEGAQDVDNAKAVRADIESAKATLGTALFTELKNKAVKRYYLVDSRNKVEAAINSLPSPDEPGATSRFEEAERVLASAKRHLGDELHDQFSITLADMKPEYVA
jgi:hypothetical protein